MSISSPQAGVPRRLLYAVGGVLLAVLIAGVGGYVWLGSDAQGANAIGGPFTLQDGDGKMVTDATFRGRFMLVYFGYTFCPDVCPTTLTTVADVMDKLGPDASRLQPIFITVDPQRDTPAVVKQYVSAFSPRLVGLTGTPEEIQTVAREYRVYYAIHRTPNDGGNYSVDHSSILYLMGPDGRFIEPLPADATAEQIAQEVHKRLGQA